MNHQPVRAVDLSRSLTLLRSAILRLARFIVDRLPDMSLSLGAPPLTAIKRLPPARSGQMLHGQSLISDGCYGLG